MKAIHPLIICMLVLLALSAGSCGKHGTRQENRKNTVETSRGLEIYRNGDCWVAKVISPTDSAANLGVYIFPDKDESRDIPQIEGAVVLPPSRRQRVMLYSSVHASALNELGRSDIIKAIGDAQFFTDPKITEGLKKGTIADAGSQQEPVQERIIAAKPDLIIISHYDGVDVSKLEKLGIPVIYMRESAEEDPLGRAEWIKLLGLIAGNKDKADSIFTQVKGNYNSLAAKAAACKEPKPTVMAENMYQGTWYVSGGKSYAAQLIKDAGGKYLWDDDTQAGSLPLSFEAVLAKAADADIWLLKVFSRDMTLKALEQDDPRYMRFKPTKTGGVWCADTQKVPLFEETPFHPELLLEDYIKIFHPSVSDVSATRYFRNLK